MFLSNFLKFLAPPPPPPFQNPAYATVAHHHYSQLGDLNFIRLITTTRVLLTTQFLTFNRLNSQYNSPTFKANKKVCNVLFGQTLSNLVKTRYR